MEDIRKRKCVGSLTESEKRVREEPKLSFCGLKKQETNEND